MLEYEQWFCAQVQEALDDPSPSILNDVIEAEFAQKRHEICIKAQLNFDPRFEDF